MRRITIAIAVVVTLVLMAGILSAQSPSPVVIEVTSGTDSQSPTAASQAGITCPCFVGGTLATPDGGPWDHVTFNFYANPAVGTAPASGPLALGTAFLLTQPYLGTPANLSSSTPGYVAASTAIVNGVYFFPTSVVINPNTQYWVYENGPFTTGTISVLGDTSFPNQFFAATAPSTVQNFTEGESIWNYTLGGIPVAAGTCSYVLDSGGQTFTAAGGNGAISITAPAGCSWTATSGAGWISITGASSGTGNGTVTYQVSANTGSAQTGAIDITALTGNVSFTVMQGAASVTSYTNGGAIAQLASAGGWTTTFTFVNTGATAAQMRLNFYNGNGTPLTLPLRFRGAPNAAGPILAATLDATIAPGTELVILTTGPASRAIKTGWAQLSTNGSITGFATYSEVVGSSVQDALVSLQGGNVTGYIVPYDNTNGSGTGIALANTTTQTITVNVKIYIGGAPGSTNFGLTDSTTNTLTLQPRSYMAFFLASQYTDTAQLRGTIEFSTSTPGQISLLALRFNPTGAFSSIPSFPTSN